MLSLPPPCSVTLKSWSHSHVKVKPASILPLLKNPQCLARVRRVKFSTTFNASNHAIHGILELINDKGARVCLEKALDIGVPCHLSYVREGADDNLNLAHLNCLKHLDARSAEILCMEGYGLWAGDAPAVDLVKEVLDNLGNITTLILSNATIEPCLLALEANTGAVNNAQGFSQYKLSSSIPTPERTLPRLTFCEPFSQSPGRGRRQGIRSTVSVFLHLLPSPCLLRVWSESPSRL